MRLFFAVELPDEVKRNIADMQKVFAPGVRLVPEKNLHLTVAFLGEQNEQAVPELLKRARLLPLPPAFSVQASGVGNFGRVLWVGAASRLLDGMLALFHRTFTPAEKLPYPHITFGRTVSGISPGILDTLNAYAGMKFGEVPVNAIVLKESVLIGTRYETLGKVPLVEGGDG